LAACSFCKKAAANKKSQEKIKSARAAQIAANAKEVERRQLLGLEVDPLLLPRKRGPKAKNGDDPVVYALRALLYQNTNQDNREKEREERFVTASNEKPSPELVYTRWKRRLFAARAVVFNQALQQRRLDLLHPVLAVDPERMHWLAYIDPADRRTLDDIAYKVNARAVPQHTDDKTQSYKGRRFVGLPSMRSMQLSTTGEAASVLYEQWRPHKESIARTKRNSNAALRGYHGRKRKRIVVFTTSGVDRSRESVAVSYTFTIEEYHARRVECCDAALKQIDEAVRRGDSPVAWRCPWYDERTEQYASSYNVDNASKANATTIVTGWSQLVPPMMRNELAAMWKELPDNLRKALLPFPKHDRRTRFQIRNNLDSNNVLRQPAPVALRPQEEE
jgi:hypothetical protein